MGIRSTIGASADPLLYSRNERGWTNTAVVDVAATTAAMADSIIGARADVLIPFVSALSWDETFQFRCGCRLRRMIAASDLLPDDKNALKAALIEVRAKLSGAEAMIEHPQLVIAKMKCAMWRRRRQGFDGAQTPRPSLRARKTRAI
jgi:hypothetical protein